MLPGLCRAVVSEPTPIGVAHACWRRPKLSQEGTRFLWSPLSLGVCQSVALATASDQLVDLDLRRTMTSGSSRAGLVIQFSRASSPRVWPP